jgi:hypothetical protein
MYPSKLYNFFLLPYEEFAGVTNWRVRMVCFAEHTRKNTNLMSGLKFKE